MYIKHSFVHVTMTNLKSTEATISVPEIILIAIFLIIHYLRADYLTYGEVTHPEGRIGG